MEGGYANLGTAKANGTIGGQPATFDRDVSAWDVSAVMFAPLGAQYSIGRSFAVRAEFQRYTKTGGPSLTPYVGTAAEDPVDLASLGVLRKF